MNIVNENLPPEETEDLSQVYIFPHSITVSAEPVLPKEEYIEVFGNSVYTIYLDFYSQEPKSKYVANLVIMDLMHPELDMEKIVYFETLDCPEYDIFLKSFGLIFKPFKRNILNFEPGTCISMQDYLETVRNWLPKPENLDDPFINFDQDNDDNH